jgi:hypothetical protein
MTNNLAKCEHLQPYLQLAHNLIHTYHPSHIGFKVKDSIQAISKIYTHTFARSHWQNHTWNLFAIPSFSQIAQQLNLDQNIIQSFLDPPISLHITNNSCILFSKCPIIWAIVRNIYHDLPFSYPQCANYVDLSHTCWDITFDNPWFIRLYIDRHNKTLCNFFFNSFPPITLLYANALLTILF